MKLRVLIIVLPSFVIVSGILIYVLFIDLNNLLLGFTFSQKIQ